MTKTSLSTATPIDTTYSYYDSERGSGYTTTKLESETIDGVTYTYEYDTLGNITDIYRGNTHLYYYEYDAMNQLTFVLDYENAKSYSYTYDTAGNLIAENISDVNSNGSAYNTVHKSYQYNDTNWGDKLTSYDGQTITYDAIGNPLYYRDGMTMTWKNGRQLATLQDSDDNISYTYDSESVRTSKTVDGVKHTYAYLGGKLMYETRGESKFYYSYDANGVLYSVKYTLTDTSDMLTYFFTHNSRGDIVGIYDSNGVQQVKYEYDAWGNILSVTDSQGNAITDQNHIANLNPFRYRGYYYDNETGLYYLMSRYYDSVTHRFINADGYFQSDGGILNTNMFAYCKNNPIIFKDNKGMYPTYSGVLYDGTTFSGVPTHQLGYLGQIKKYWQDGEIKPTVATVTKEKIDYKNPPTHPNYSPPKHNKGKLEQVKNPNGNGKGWPAKDGGVWVPDDNMHGGPGWTVQYPGGSHEHAYPGGHIRKAQEVSNPIGGTTITLLGVLAVGYLCVNDLTGVGVCDDCCIPAAAGCVVYGIDQMQKKYVCDCGESWYEFG